MTDKKLHLTDEIVTIAAEDIFQALVSLERRKNKIALPTQTERKKETGSSAGTQEPGEADGVSASSILTHLEQTAPAQEGNIIDN